MNTRRALTTAFAGICFLGATLGAAALPTKPSPRQGESLFVSTDPMDAVVLLDGRTLPDMTPLLLRDLAPGPHRLTITRIGYRTVSREIHAAAGAVAAITVSLDKEFFTPILPSGEKLAFEGRVYAYSSNNYQIPTGDYSIRRAGETITLTPLFPGQEALSFFNVLSPIMIGLSGIATAEALFSTSRHPDWTAPLLSYVGSALSVGVDLSLHLQKARYLGHISISPVPKTLPAAAARYRQGNRLLADGDLADAADEYISLINQRKGSVYFPLSLYKLAAIHIIQGDTMLATAELRLIVEKYPLPQIYDKACKSLADLADQQHDYPAALGYLGKMVFYDPLYSRSQIDRYRAQIESKLRSSAK